MASRFAPLLIIPGLILCGLLVRFANTHLEQEHAAFHTDEIEAAKESIALSLMGQLQFTAQSLVWMKTLEYLHNGVAFRMPTNAEEEHGFRAQNSIGTAGGLEHSEGVPMALNEKLDWRGPVGDLQRTILPHMTKHTHSDPVELIPWYEFALKLNPNVERLYTMGAFFMADFAKEPNRAIRLLEKGVQANPWTYEVRGSLGRLLVEYHQQLGITAKEAYERAVVVLQEAVDLAEKEKIRLEENKDHFDDYQKQIFRESYLFLARSLTELGRYEEAIQICDRGLKTTGHNHLNVQKRIITRRMNGEVDEEKEKSLSPSADTATTNPDRSSSRKASSNQAQDVSAKSSLSISLGIAPPKELPAGEETPLLRSLLTDVYLHPYEMVLLRKNRLTAELPELLQAAQTLAQLRFIATEKADPDSPLSEKSSLYLTPIGLYVHDGDYGFDFWTRMTRDAESQRQKGVPTDLIVDALHVAETMK